MRTLRHRKGIMHQLRRQEGTALLATILAVGIMVTLGFATLSIVDAQTGQTRAERTSESAFNLAEATLNAQAFLLGRSWPRSASQVPVGSSPAAPCSGQTLSGTVTAPAASATPSMHDQIQSMLAQTYSDSGAAAAGQWWVSACESGGRSAWDASILNGLAYDPSIASSPSAKPRRMWVRAEGHVGAHKRAVVGLVQAGQASVYPNLAVVTGQMGADLGNTLGALTSGSSLLGGVLGMLIGSEPMYVGNVGLRCSLLDSGLLGCLSGLLKVTSALLPILQSSQYVHFAADSVVRADQLTQLRQQAEQSNTYYGPTSAGVGTVANNAPCLPAGAAGKIIFIQQIGDGTGSCVLNTASTPAAAALIVGAGGVKVQGGGTFTGVIHTLRKKALAGDAADVRIENGSRVDGGVYTDDNAALGAKAHGQVLVITPPVTLSASSPLCNIFLLGFICGTVDALVNVLGLGAVLGQILPQLTAALPAVTYNATVVNAVMTFGESATINGTFRQVGPAY